MKDKEYLTNKSFCPMPWTGLMYNFDGNVKNCIRSSAPIGNIKDDPIEDILSGSKNITTKIKMLDGIAEDR
jgi:MoaA/NifB/PqqE/SkfB family radical SAM enzyme